jgi:serine/threonine-protein kinase
VSQEQGLVPTQQWATPRPTIQPSALDLLRQDTLGEYEILAELGRGGMATVYLAHDIPLDRKVAIKVMSAALMDEGLAERFRREARTAAALNHPHIIPVYAVRERSGLLYFVMKYIGGQSLDPIVKSGTRISIPMAHIILAQAASALGYAHRRGVIHRDVKPANIMLDDEGWVVMTDFGIAKVATATGLTMTGVTVGTPAYMSPEQCAGKEVNGASDQYSLGVLAYELITGQKPFTATTAMAMMYSHFNDTPAPLSTLRPDCPPELEQKVMRMLAKAPEDRWPSIEEIFGAPSLAHDDPTRQALVTLAMSNPNVAVGRISTPTSPIPPARRSPSATVPMPQGLTSLPGAATRPAMPGRVPVPRPAAITPTGYLIGGVAAAALLIAGYFALRPRPTPAAGIADTTGAPVTPVALDTTTRPADSTPIAPPPQPQPETAAPLPEAPAVVTLAGVRANTTSIDLEIGKSTRVTAEVLGSDGNVMPRHGTITWRSSAPRIASVARDGTVRGLAAGTAGIYVAVGGKADTIAVRVSAPAVTPPPPVVAAAPVETTVTAPAAVASVALSGPTAPMKVGESAALSLLVKDDRGQPLSDRRATWESSDAAVVSVANGTITARGAGTATITATVERRTATLRVTVATPIDPAAERVRANTEIAGILNAFAGAVDRRNMSQLKAAYPTLPPDDESRWSKMFAEKSLRKIDAEFEAIEAAQIDQNSATQRVRLKLQQVYSGQAPINSASVLLARFEQLSGKWQMVQLVAP